MSLDEQGRPEPPLNAGELDTLVGFLDFQRATIDWKTAGLDAEALRTPLPPSAMTLGGLLKHLAFVEEYWCTYRLRGEAPAAPWVGVDWSADPDWDWHSAARDTPDALRAGLAQAQARSRAHVADAVARGGLEEPLSIAWGDGSTPSVRWLLVHLIEEYARHAGHADLLREALDGLTGE